MKSLTIRRYGNAGPFVILLHGGPGAPGYMAPVARGLADSFRVLEPFQRASGKEPLSVAGHVADLQEIVRSQCEGMTPAIVGHSWGAMLALAYAAENAESTGPLVLIGSGTFDPASRQETLHTRQTRMDDEFRKRMRLTGEICDPNEAFRAMGELFLPLDSYDLATTEMELGGCDVRAFDESWQDMLRLQEDGTYPASFHSIKTPVLMLHGAADPHPGEIIRASLQPYLPQLEYLELERCGHYPWLEQYARDRFFDVLRSWLVRHAGGT